MSSLVINNRDHISKKMLQSGIANMQSSDAVAWEISSHPVDYEEAIQKMEQRVSDIHAGHAPELVWLLEHPPLYTAGTSAKMQDLLLPHKLPVYQTGRGGEFTYHGPGQRIAYVMLDLKKRQQDLRLFVSALEEWIIRSLQTFDIQGERREDRVGVWVQEKNNHINSFVTENKIAAIGIRVRRWVSFHGISINLNPDLSHYAGIVPCGIQQYGVTSIASLKPNITMHQLDQALHKNFNEIFLYADSLPCPK